MLTTEVIARDSRHRIAKGDEFAHGQFGAEHRPRRSWTSHAQSLVSAYRNQMLGDPSPSDTAGARRSARGDHSDLEVARVVDRSAMKHGRCAAAEEAARRHDFGVGMCVTQDSRPLLPVDRQRSVLCVVALARFVVDAAAHAVERRGEILRAQSSPGDPLSDCTRGRELAAEVIGERAGWVRHSSTLFDGCAASAAGIHDLWRLARSSQWCRNRRARLLSSSPTCRSRTRGRTLSRPGVGGDKLRPLPRTRGRSLPQQMP